MIGGSKIIRLQTISLQELITRIHGRILNKILIIRFKIMFFDCRVVYKAYLILLLFILSGSVFSSPGFIKNSQHGGFQLLSMALADDSSDDNSSSSEDDSSKDQSGDSSKDQSGDSSKDQSGDSSKDQSGDSSKDQSGDSSKSEGDECVNTDASDENILEAANDKSQSGSCHETEKTTDKTDEKTTDKTDEKTTDKTDEKTTDKTDENVGVSKITKADVGEVKEHTLLDEILSDHTLIKEVINDKTTDPSLASSLLVLQEEQVPDKPLVETCGNQVDDDGDGTIDEDCGPVTTQPTETCGNQADDDGDGTIDEEECVVPPTETCGNQADDDGDGTIDEEECVVPPTEICDNGSDDDNDGKTDSADKADCPAVIPTVVIQSAKDQNGKTLSPGDTIAPGEVTFKFSAKSDETSTDSQENSQHLKFECALDGKSFDACNSPETVRMNEGKHTFEVKLVS
jgi:hypothetical protein